MKDTQLTKRTGRALVWSTIERFGQQGFQMLFSVILARILLPSEFGIVAMLGIFLSIGQTISEGGLGLSLIQKREITHANECSIFYYNLSVAVLFIVLLWVSAPFIAHFYRLPILQSIVYVLSLNLLFSALSLVPASLLTKKMSFGKQAAAGLISVLVSGLAGIVLAMKGAGVWSLVIQSIAFSIIRLSLIWYLSGWFPRLGFGLKGLQGLWGFGSKVLIISLMDTVFRNAYSATIGKVNAVKAVGLYSMAGRLTSLPTNALTTVISRVAFPLFSESNQDIDKMRGILRRMLRLTVLVHWPLIVGIAVLADSLTGLILSAKWLEAVPYLRLLCIVAVMDPIATILNNAITALGRADLCLYFQIAFQTVTAILLAVTWRYGVEAMIVGQIVAAVFSVVLYVVSTRKLLCYPYHIMVLDLLPYLAIALLTALAGFLPKFFLRDMSYSRFALQIFASASTFLIVCAVFRVSGWRDFLDLIKRSVK